MPHTCVEREVLALEFHAKYEYAIFYIDDQPERKHHTLSIVSSFGSYGYTWTHPGKSFFEFLSQLNVDYLLGKMVRDEDEVYCEDASIAALKVEILRARRANEITREQARKEYDDIEFYELNHEMGFSEYFSASDYFTDFDIGDYIKTEEGQKSREFRALYNLFWPALTHELHKRMFAAGQIHA